MKKPDFKKLGKNIKEEAPMILGATAAGAIGGGIRKLVTKYVPTEYQYPWLINAAPLIVGAIAVGLSDPKKDKLVFGAGLGLCALSGQGFGQQFGLGDPYIGEAPDYIQIEGIDMGATDYIGEIEMEH